MKPNRHVAVPIERGRKYIWIQGLSAYLQHEKCKSTFHRIQGFFHLTMKRKGLCGSDPIRSGKISESEVEAKIAPLFFQLRLRAWHWSNSRVKPVKLGYHESERGRAGCYPPAAWWFDRSVPVSLSKLAGFQRTERRPVSRPFKMWPSFEKRIPAPSRTV